MSETLQALVPLWLITFGSIFAGMFILYLINPKLLGLTGRRKVKRSKPQNRMIIYQAEQIVNRYLSEASTKGI